MDEFLEALPPVIPLVHSVFIARDYQECVVVWQGEDSDRTDLKKIIMPSILYIFIIL